MKCDSLKFSVLLVFMLLAACGDQPETGQAQEQASTMPATLAPEEQPGALAETADQAAAAALEAIEESASESEERAIETEELIALAETAGPGATASQTAWQYPADKYFIKFTTAQGTSSPPDVIEVAEVFWYGCPHCFNFDPIVNAWKQNLPDDVNFVRIPVMWNPTNEIHARMFYTAEALGKLDEMHEAIFRDFHINRNMLDSEDAIRQFFVRFGVSEDDFNKTFRSFAVESKLKRARNLTQRYQITSVPILVTNGKYLTKGDGVKTFDDMLAVTDELVERERQPL